MNVHVDSFIDEYTVISDSGWLLRIPPRQKSLLDNNMYSAVPICSQGFSENLPFDRGTI